MKAWDLKRDTTPVTNPFPSRCMLPSLLDDDNVEDEEEEEPEIISLYGRPTPSIDAARIARVVSYDDEDEEEDPASLLATRHCENLGAGGDVELTVLLPSKKEDPKNKIHDESTTPPPRRLDFASALSEPPTTIWEAMPPNSKLPKHCNHYAALFETALRTQDQLGVRKAEFILRYMLTEYKSGRSKIRPDGGMYNSVMHGHALLGNAEKVEELLQVMCKEYENGDELAAPNTKHYTTLLHAWQKANVPHGPERAEQILSNMHKMNECGVLSCKPDLRTYTTVLHTWSSSTRQDAGERAEALFREMKTRYESGDVGLRPDRLAYCNMINAASNSGGFLYAEQLLWEMVDEYLKGNATCKPCARSFNTILSVWSKSSATYAPERAEELVRRWIRLNDKGLLDIEPDGWSYSLVLKCWYALRVSLVIG
jgi:pentatricopeptide repeat protein